MKVQCGQCPAKYAVSDERVRDRKVRIHCKRCGASIVVDGKVDPPLITSTPARPSVRPPTQPAPLPESPLPPEPDPEAQPSPRPVAHTIMGGLEAPAAERLQQQREALPARPGRSMASPFEAHEASHLPAEHRGLTEPPAGTDDNRWRVALTKQDLRWMTTDEIVEAFRSGAVKHETFVFRAGMPTWVTLPEVPEIAAALAQAAASGELPASALPPQKPPSSRPPPRKMPARPGGSDANALAALAELDSAEPMPFALVAERSNGATAPGLSPAEDARHFPAPRPARGDEVPARAPEPPEPERPSIERLSIERLSIEAMPVDHLSHIPDEPFAPPPFAAAQQASGSSKWVWIVVGLLLLGAAAAFVAARQGVKLF